MTSGINLPEGRLGAVPPDYTGQPPGGGPAMLETFLSLMPDAAVAVDAAGTIVAVNARTEAFFGYRAGELEGKPIELLVPERSRHSHRRQRASYSSDPHARPMGAGLELYARRKDGSEFPVDISLAPIGAEEEPLVVAAVRDISERKAAESAQAQLAAIVESSADAIFSITRDGVITSWNPAAQVMFDYDRDAVLGHHISQFFPDDPVLEDLLDAARSGRPTPSHDTRWLRQDGHPIDVAISVSLLDVRGQQGYSLLVRDITIRKAAELELRRQALWQRAAAEIRLSLLSEAPLTASLDLICRWALDISGSSAGLIVVQEDTCYRVQARAGDRAVLEAAEAAVGRLPAGRVQSVAEWEALFPSLSVHAFPIAMPTENGTGAALVLVTDRQHLHGGSTGMARGGAGLGDRTLASTALAQTVESLANQAVLAFELANVRSQRDRLLISADRERIARDLHDLVIQRIFGAGLRLQGALALIDNPGATARVSSTIDDLDATIREIREAIFALESPPGTGLRARLTNTVSDMTDALGLRPSFSFRSSRETEVPVQVQAEAAAVLREALSNAARHAKAKSVDVSVELSGELRIVVTDNGRGLRGATRVSGIGNARARAEKLGGQLEVTDAPGGGTRFDWRVPVPDK